MLLPYEAGSCAGVLADDVLSGSDSLASWATAVGDDDDEEWDVDG